MVLGGAALLSAAVRALFFTSGRVPHYQIQLRFSLARRKELDTIRRTIRMAASAAVCTGFPAFPGAALSSRSGTGTVQTVISTWLMDVESKRKFKHGFILTESDVRRLIDTVIQQLQKTTDAQLSPPKFRITFRSGVVSDVGALDDVLAQENSGSKKIIRLNYTQHTSEHNPSSISLEFINADEDDEPDAVSLRYHILGHDRDWVFVTSSLLDERFEKVRRFAPNQLGSRTVSRAVAFILFPLAMILGLFFSLPSSKGKPTPSERLEHAWSEGNIKDTVSAIIFIEREKEAQEKQKNLAAITPFAFVFGVFIVLLLVWFFFYKYYLVYNFCWGEYVEEFRRKEAARKFWLVVVAVGLALSFLGSVLANRVHW